MASGDGAEKLLQGMNDSKEFKDRIAVLTIAYHNLAVEQEFMHMVRLKTLSLFPCHTNLLW